MSVTRYSRDIDLDDLENVHTFAVLAVPPGSRVLDLGAADGSVARALRDRGCDVTAVERDAEGVAVLRSGDLRVVQADLDAVDVHALPQGAFDVVLMLDVLEHLVDPAALLAKTRAWLAPGGRTLVSVPNVAHGAVRLSLLQGHFPRTDIGLLDRTHLHFFEQNSLRALLAGAGFGLLDVLTVERGLAETELPVMTAPAPGAILEALADDPLSRAYQFFVVAAPLSAQVDGGGLLQALLGRVRTHQAAYRALEEFAAQAAATGRAREEAVAAELRRAREQASAAAARLVDIEADRDTLRYQLTGRMEELQQAGDTIAVLLRDLDVQREFADTLATQVPRIAARGGEVRVLDQLDRYQAVAPTPEAAAGLAAEAAEFRRLQGAVAFRALAGLDAWLRTVPWLRVRLSRLARWLADASR